MLYHFRATFLFSRLGVRDHTGGPGGSLHTFSPVRKYDRPLPLVSVCNNIRSAGGNEGSRQHRGEEHSQHTPKPIP